MSKSQKEIMQETFNKMSNYQLRLIAEWITEIQIQRFIQETKQLKDKEAENDD